MPKAAVYCFALNLSSARLESFEKIQEFEGCLVKEKLDGYCGVGHRSRSDEIGRNVGALSRLYMSL